MARKRFKDVIYIQFVYYVCSKKKEPNCAHAIMGSNLINYPKNIGNNTAKLLLIKIFLNSVIITLVAQFMTIDLANFYLMTPLK